MTLSAGVENRTIELILSGIEPMAAIQQAMAEENAMISTLVNDGWLTPKGKKVAAVVSDSIYNHVNTK